MTNTNKKKTRSSELVRDNLGCKQAHREVELIRDSLIQGFQDVIEGRVHKFSGSLSEMSLKLKSIKK